MITRIEAYRYRCFEKLDVALGRTRSWSAKTVRENPR